MPGLFQTATRNLLRLFGYWKPPKTQRPVAFDFNAEGDNQANMAWGYYDSRMSLAQSRLELYKEMEEMDDDDIIQSALDAFAEDSTQPDPFTARSIWAEGSNPEIIDIVHRFFDQIELEDVIYSICREMCKYGDCFEQVLTSPGKGVIGIEWIDPKSVERIQDEDGRIAGFKVFDGEIPNSLDQIWVDPSKDPEKGGEDMTLPWDLVHFRLLGGRRTSQRPDFTKRGILYGQAICSPARRTWRRFRMAEDEMLMYRMRRAPDRDIFYIDCTGLNPGEQWEHARRWYKEFKKRQFLNAATSDYKTEMNPMAADEDIFLPTVEGRNTRIERQAGSANVGEIHDINFYINRVFSTLRIPKEYFGFDSEGWDQNKALSQKDIRFARTCKRIQRAVIQGISRLTQIHLAHIGIDPTLPHNEFTLKMTPTSLLDEQGRAELYTVRMDLIDKLIVLGDTIGLDKHKWVYYVARTFGGFPERIARSMLKDAGSGTPPDAGLGGGLDLGGEAGGLDLGGETGGLDLGAEVPAEELDLGVDAETETVPLESVLDTAIQSDERLKKLYERFLELQKSAVLVSPVSPVRDPMEKLPLISKDKKPLPPRPMPVVKLRGSNGG